MNLTAELPGVEEKDLDVTLAAGVLTIRGEKKSGHDEQDKDKRWHVVERSYGRFSRTISLPFYPDPAKVEARLDKGVLQIHLPKPLEMAKKQQKIEIKKAYKLCSRIKFARVVQCTWSEFRESPHDAHRC